MRILFLTSRDWMDSSACGGDLCSTDYARCLAAKGHQVTLLVAWYPGSAKEEVVEGVRIVRPGGLFLLALSALAYYARHRNEFDVVYEEGMASVRLPFLAPLYVRKPLVTMWYQVNAPIFAEQYPPPFAWLLTGAERLLLALHRRCRMLTLSRERMQEVIATGFRREQVEVVPPPMLDSRPRAVSDRNREPLIVWLGKLRRYKCPHHVIEAMPDVLRRVPNARLVIAGRRDDEGYEAELLGLAERLGVRDRVSVRVDISAGEKWEVLAQARALVVTSPVEGFGIVIVEANRCGTPVVATDGVPAETARDGYNGLRVAFGDRRALAMALVRLLSDRTLFEVMSGNARQHAGHFSAERVAEQLEDMFSAAASNGAAA